MGPYRGHRSRRAGSAWFSYPFALTFRLGLPASSDVSPRLRRRREPGRFPFSLAPRGRAPCGWRAQRRPACASWACSPAGAPARDRRTRPGGWCSGSPTSPRPPAGGASPGPFFDILPSRGLPAVLCWRGVRPSQAEKSRPLRKVSSGGAKAWSASAVIGPTPGTVIARTASSSSRAAARSTRSRQPSGSGTIRPAAAPPSRAPAPAETFPPRLKRPGQTVYMRRTLGSHKAELRKMAPQRVDRLRALAHQQHALNCIPVPVAPRSSPQRSAWSGATPPRRSLPRPPRFSRFT